MLPKLKTKRSVSKRPIFLVMVLVLLIYLDRSQVESRKPVPGLFLICRLSNRTIFLNSGAGKPLSAACEMLRLPLNLFMLAQQWTNLYQKVKVSSSATKNVGVPPVEIDMA